MQPCTVCGAVTISATGHCTQCGTYRGFPPVDPANAPTYGQPPTAAVYPSGGGAYPAGGPAYPPQPGAFPGYPAPPPAPAPGPPNRGRPFVVPLVALSITLVVLVVAIVVVVIVREDETDPTVTGPSTPPVNTSPTGNPDVDPCVVGRWVVSQHREVVPIDNVGRVTFTGGRDSTLDLEADGSGVMSYPSGTSYEGSANGKTIKLEIAGNVDFEYVARDGTMSLKNLQADATAKAFVDGELVGTDRLEPDDDPANYSCLNDSLTLRTTLYTTDYTKAG
jgi:hypothetical protein